MSELFKGFLVEGEKEKEKKQLNIQITCLNSRSFA